MDDIALKRNDGQLIKLPSLESAGLGAVDSPNGQSGTEDGEKEPASTSSSDRDAARAQQEQRPYPWILNPTIDLLLCCGGLFWILFAIYRISGVKPDLFGSPLACAMMATAVIGLHIFGDPHQPATLYRVYFSAPTRKALGKPTAVWGVIALAAALCTYFVHSASIFLVKAVIAWGLQHQLSQSYGIALVYCFKRGVRLTKNEKLIMAGMINATITYLMLRMFTYEPYGHQLAPGGLDLPLWNLVPEPITQIGLYCMQFSILLFVAMVVRKYVKEKVVFPFPALLTLTTLVIMPFLAGTSFVFVWVWLSTTFFHSAQYICVTSAYYFKEKGLPENVSLWQISKMLKTWQFARYFGIIFSVGFLLSFLLPTYMADHGADKALAFSSIWVFVNFHHFAVDSFIWKLRDPALQKLLIS